MHVKLNTPEIFILVALDTEVLQYLADREIETHEQELEIRDQLYTSDSDESIAVRVF